jgi:DNA-directed RNA polymerase specialized sigma24 family protein
MHEQMDEVLATPSLTDWQRTVFRLCELDGHTVTDAALILHCSKSAVWQGYAKAKRTLARATYYDGIDGQQTVRE